MGYPESYDILPNNITQVVLREHNNKAYKEAIEQINQYGRSAVVAPTGTGKSYIMMKMMQDMYNSDKLVLGPSKGVLEELKTLPEWVANNTVTGNYSSLGRTLRELEESEIEPKLIVLDEMHRVGAEVWGGYVAELLETYPKAIVLGLTATPMRYLDKQRDMVEEMFNGVSAGNLTLGEAIEKGILPAPIYVTAMFDINKDARSRLMAVSGNEYQRQTVLKLVNQYKLTHDTDEIIVTALKNHIGDCGRVNYKHIVFASRTKKADAMKETVRAWFQKVYPDRSINVYVVHSKVSDRDMQLSSFCTVHDNNTIDIMIAVDMANEGFHVKNTKSIIMLRSTSSPNVYLQQMGRALASGGEQPVIFDFVENLQALGDVTVFMGNMQYKVNRRGLYSIQQRSKIFKEVHDYTQDWSDVIDAIEYAIGNTWDSQLERVIEEKNAGASRINQLTPKLGNWMVRQQKLFLGGQLRQDRHRKFNDLGHMAYATVTMKDFDEKWFKTADMIWLIKSGQMPENMLRKQVESNFIADIKRRLMHNELPTGARVYLEYRGIAVSADEKFIIKEAKSYDSKIANRYVKLMDKIHENVDKLDLNSESFDLQVYEALEPKVYEMVSTIIKEKGNSEVYSSLFSHWIRHKVETKEIIETEPDALEKHALLMQLGLSNPRYTLSEVDEIKLNRLVLGVDKKYHEESTKKLMEKLGLDTAEGLKEKISDNTAFGKAYKVLMAKQSKIKDSTSKAEKEAQKVIVDYSKYSLSPVYVEMLDDLNGGALIDPIYHMVRSSSLEEIFSDKNKMGMVGMIYAAMSGDQIAVNTIKKINSNTKLNEKECIKLLIGAENFPMMFNAVNDFKRFGNKETELVKKWIKKCVSDEILGYAVIKLSETSLFSYGKGVNILAASAVRRKPHGMKPVSVGIEQEEIKILDRKAFSEMFYAGHKKADRLIRAGIPTVNIVDIDVKRWIRDTKVMFDAGVATKSHIDIIRNMGFNL